MAGSASYSTLLTPVRVPRRNSPVFGDSPVPSPLRAAPTLHLPPRRVSAGVSAAYTTTGPSASYSSSSYYSQQTSTFSAPTVPPPSLYDVLGLSACATASEIKAAYRRLARSCHPDARNGDGGAPADSGEQFMRVHAAYATLSDPDKRAEYDRRLAGPVPSSAAGRRAGPVYPRAAAYSAPAGYRGSSSSSFGSRTWETDQCW